MIISLITNRLYKSIVLKSLIGYISIAALLHGGQFFLTQIFPEHFVVNDIFLVQTYLILTFLFSEVILFGISKLLDVYIGQLFLLTTTFKIVGTGVYVMVLKRFFGITLSKPMIYLLIVSYFIYLIYAVNLMAKRLKEGS